MLVVPQDFNSSIREAKAAGLLWVWGQLVYIVRSGLQTNEQFWFENGRESIHLLFPYKPIGDQKLLLLGSATPPKIQV